MWSKRYFLFVIVVIAAIVIVFSACSKKEAEEIQFTPGNFFGGNVRNIDDDAFHLAIGGEPISCDPHNMTTVVENHIIPSTCEGLLAWGPNGPNEDPVPGLASHFKVSDDGTVYKFHLREGLVWSNGQTLTAYDIEYSWDRASGEGFLYSFIFKEGQIESWDAKADNTFVVTLKAPNRIFLTVLPLPIMCALHQPTIDKYGDGWCVPKTFVGSGAYVPTKVVLGESIRLEKNPRYWDADNVHTEVVVAHTTENRQLVVNLYEQGRIDSTGAQTVIPPEKIEALKDPNNPKVYTVSDVYTYPIMANSYVTFNHDMPPFKKVKVRRALSLALNRQAIIDNVIKAGEVPMANFMPPGMGYDLVPYDVSQNCAEAQRLLAEAGYPGGKGFPEYEILFRVGSMEPNWVPPMVDQWKQCLGIKFTMAGMTMQLWRPRYTDRKFKLTVDGWQGDFPHPHTFVGLWHSANLMNPSGYRSAKMDAALEVALAATSQEEFQAAYEVVDRLILEEMPMINLWFRGWTTALRPEWTGWNSNILNTYPLKYIRLKSPREN